MLQTIVKISLLALICGLLFFSNQPVRAGTLLNVSDTMTRLKINTNADHTIKFNLPAGVDFDATDNEDMINIGFDEDSNAFVVGGSFTADDFTLTDGTTNYVIDSVIQGDFPQIPDCTGVVGENKVRVGVENDTDIFRFRACLGDGFTASEVDLTITIKGTAPNGTFTNPNTAGSKKNAIAIEDEGVINAYYTYFAVSIVDDDQVTVTATVDPTFTFAIYKPGTTDPTTYCWRDASNSGFGSIVGGSATVDTCKYDIYVNTNATGGYATTITPVDDGTGCHNYALNQEGVAICDYFYHDPEDDDAVTASRTTDSEYGVGSSDSDMGGRPEEVPYEATCAEDASVSAGEIYESGGLWPLTKKVAEASSPGTETVTVCHAAAASPIQPAAGVYIQVVTLISTGTF